MSDKRTAYTFCVEGQITLVDPDDFDAEAVTSDEAIQDALGQTGGFVVTRVEVVESRAAQELAR